MAITRVLLVVGGVLFFGLRGAAPASLASDALAFQAGAAAPARVTSRISVTLPQEATELVVEGKPVEGTGTTREFDSAPSARGSAQRYTFTATWQPNTYTTMTRTRTVSFRAGERVTVDLSADDPTDRVRVIYVPTPADVADEMVRLAGVGPTDVVFEPGCGDARITIAAVKGGARRGVGIDIDPDRVVESKANVKAAGLEGKIEIRLGDALDIKDLNTATVVFLYMGDHFDMLIRPHLWRELKVGARVVSHRFTMGDWKPDKTVTMTSADGGDYELHLWTITEAVKRRLEER
jgi:uncharacterized protein (TIGR03000 family)